MERRLGVGGFWRELEKGGEGEDQNTLYVCIEFSRNEQKYFKDKITVPVICLPSSSPANAKFSLDDLTKIWREKIEKNYED